MRHIWTREFLTRRIDRCYLVAAGSRRTERRELHLELARFYRKVLTALLEGPGDLRKLQPAMAGACRNAR